MGGRRYLLDALLDRHGVTLPKSLQDDLRVLLEEDGQTLAEPTVADEISEGFDTWYADAPTERVDALEATVRPDMLAGRYELLDLLGAGGMGEVRRARDHVLQRIVALKIAAKAQSRGLRSRFFQEAQATAQLEHPGIVPVYDYGELEEGDLYYTMPVIRGRTLAEAITAVHEASEPRRWRETPDGTTLRRLIVSMLTVSEAMAYAHDRGVIHRDLKPENVMVGPYGQTLVVDWGLAKVLDGREEPEPLHDSGVQTARTSSSDHTSVGTVTGTPHYMSPEQARGAVGELGPRSDVWALGAMLYELLAGRTPFQGRSKVEVIAAVIAREPDPLVAVSARPLPQELVALVGRCLQRDRAARPADAGEVADEIRAWLDGERRRSQAMALVERADGLTPEVGRKRATAAQREVEAERHLAALESWRPVEDKLPGWTLQDEARALAEEADRLEQDRLGLLRQALALVPDLPEAHDALAAYYREHHQMAERRGDHRRATELEALLRAHNLGLHDRYLEGTATVELLVDAPTARVEIRPFEERERRLVPGEPVFVGDAEGPVDLPAGSWLLTLDAPGRARTRYPIHLYRGGTWDLVPPHSDQPLPIRVPPASLIGPGEAWVADGWFTFGGDPEAHSTLPRARRLWIPGFVIQRTPVTVGDWLTFLTDLKRTGRTEDFERFRPSPEQLGLVEVGERLLPGPDREGFEWTEGHPMGFVDYQSATAYAAWRAERDGLPWRLPTELEWEKAARGTDGRRYPWGDFLDPTWCAISGSREGALLPEPVGAHPVDRSPYGVLDMAGLVTEWTSDRYSADGPDIVDGVAAESDPTPTADASGRRVGRGAAFYFAPLLARSCTRLSLSESRAEVDNGLRLVRSLPAYRT